MENLDTSFINAGGTQLPSAIMFKSYQQLNKKEILFEQGSPVEHLYRVNSGLIKLYSTNENGAQIITNIIGEGEIIGSGNALIHENVVSDTTAVCLSGTCSIHYLPIHNLSIASKQTVFYLFAPQILKEINNWRNRFSYLKNKKSELRVNETLKMLGEKFGQKFGGETLIKLPINHHDLSLMADTSRQTVTHQLNYLREHGKLIYSRNRILIRDLEML